MEITLDNTGEARMPDFPSTTKCEFCDVRFTCDLDVSRHLTSDLHTQNKANFANTFSQKENNKTTRREVPKNMNQVLQLLKIKNVKDIEYLADRNYFKISSESQADLATELSRFLLKSYIQHATKDLPPEIRQVFDQATHGVDNSETSALKSGPTTPTTPAAAAAAPATKASRASTVPPKAPVVPPKAPVVQPKAPIVPPKAPVVSSASSTTTSGKRKDSPGTSKQPPAQRKQPELAQATASTSVPMPRPASMLAPNAVQAVRQKALQRPIQVKAEPGQPAKQVSASVPSAPIRPSVPRLGFTPTNGLSTTAPKTAEQSQQQPQQQQKQQEQQKQQKQKQTSDQVSPRKDSTYIPKLSIIKVEPKDD